MTDKFTPAQAPQIRRLLDKIADDGHSIFTVAVLAEFPEALRRRFETLHASHPEDARRQIYNAREEPVTTLAGIYGLDVLRGICHDLNLDYKFTFGRGSTALSCTQSIRKWLETVRD